MDYIIREFKIGDIHDAELLAEMWNASESGWPWGWTLGIPETAERIMERTQKIDRLAIFVVEVNGEIVGYGDMSRTRGRDDSVSLDLLNVRPDFQGKGLGKALVLKIIERAVELGYKLVTLGTWSGNTKSVPLYKKTGFFWVPESNAFMHNYIPTALSMPIAKDFFAKHDWYRCFKREIEIAPDDIEWKGIKVFPYRFEEDGDLFAMWIDWNAESPTAIETNDFYAGCIIGKEEIVCGLEYKVKWEIVNKKREPLQVALMAEGKDGIELNAMESLKVDKESVIEKSFKVSPDVEPKEKGAPSNQIKSVILINGIPITLGTSIKPVQPIDIQFGTRWVVAGKPNTEVVVDLKSNLDFPVQGELQIDPHPSLLFDNLSAPFTVEPLSWTSCKFYLQVNGDGVFSTKMHAICPHSLNPGFISENYSLATKSKTVMFISIPFDSVYAWYYEESKLLAVETPSFTLRVNLRGGDTTINDRLTGRQFFYYRIPELGPPFPSGYRIPPTYSYRLEKKDGKISVVLIIAPDNVPGITIERTITVGAGGFIRVDHRIINATNIVQKLKMRNDIYFNLQGKITLPLKDGILHAPYEGWWGGFPLYNRDIPKNPSDYAESWFAKEEFGLVTGMVFGDCEERGENDIQFDLPEIAPKSCYDMEPIYLVAMHGNWKVVRQLWQWLKQPSSVHEKREPLVYPVLSAGFETLPLFITQSETLSKLVIKNRREKTINGSWQIDDCKLQIHPVKGDLVEINKDNPLIQEISLSAPDLNPRVETPRIKLIEEPVIHDFPAPIIVAGNAEKPVEVKFEPYDDKPSTISVDNGYFSFTSAPDFFGSVVALTHDGINYLDSAYPRAIPYRFFNPWSGGIHAYLGWLGNQRFLKEKFAGEQVERIGKNGIAWRGVKISSEPQHRDDRWLRMETEYLVIGNSNILAIVHRFINKTDAPQGAGTGLYMWLKPGGEGDIVYYMKDQPNYEQAGSTDDHKRVLCHRRHSEYEFRGPCGHWVAVKNGQTGVVLAIVAPNPDSNINFSIANKDVTMFVGVEDWLNLHPKETKEMLSWLVICNSVEQAQEYQALAEVYELP